jgi:hypothetical protein
VAGRSICYRDVEYLGYDLVSELDGRLGHESEVDRWADMDRDNRSAGDALTLRFGHRHVMDRACETAAIVADGLRRRGWQGSPRRCGPDCRLWC